MSYNTLALQVDDVALRERVDAAIQQEARQPANVGTDEGLAVIRNRGGVLDNFVWWVSSATEAAYASAVAADNPNPGGDEAVITDQAILSAVQASWDTVLGTP